MSGSPAFRRIGRPGRYDVVLPVLVATFWLLAERFGRGGWHVFFAVSAAWFLGVLVAEWFRLRWDVAAAVAEAMYARGVPLDLIARWRFLEVRRNHVPPAAPNRSSRRARARQSGRIKPGRFTP